MSELLCSWISSRNWCQSYYINEYVLEIDVN